MNSNSKRGGMRGKMPENVALDAQQQTEFNQKVKELKDNPHTPGSGVVYIGHIPHGFHEAQMKMYFEQFGKVRRLRISRSKKTGNIKGYAFVQFIDDYVAKVVVDCMNNYLMFHKLLKCQYVPISRLHPDTFKGSERAFVPPKAHRLSRIRHNSTKSKQKVKENRHRSKKRTAKSLKKLGDMGIDFEFPGLVKIEGKPADVSMDSISSEVDDSMDMQDGDLDSSILDAAKSFLLVDSEEDEIEFPRTPPGARRKSLSDFKRTPKAVFPLKDEKRADSAKVTLKGTRKRKAQSLTPAAKRRK